MEFYQQYLLYIFEHHSSPKAQANGLGPWVHLSILTTIFLYTFLM
jgi:hypothetical protein